MRLGRFEAYIVLQPVAETGEAVIKQIQRLGAAAKGDNVLFGQQIGAVQLHSAEGKLRTMDILPALHAAIGDEPYHDKQAQQTQTLPSARTPKPCLD